MFVRTQLTTTGSQNSGQPTPPPLLMHASSSSNGGGVTSPSDQVSGGSSAVPTPGPGQSGPRRMSTSSRLEGKEEVIGFDEGILRGLCDMDVRCIAFQARHPLLTTVCTASPRGPNKAEHRVLQGE